MDHKMNIKILKALLEQYPDDYEVEILVHDSYSINGYSARPWSQNPDSFRRYDYHENKGGKIVIDCSLNSENNKNSKISFRK